MASKWIEHVKAYAKKHKMSYKEAMSKSRASYKPMKGGAMVGRDGHGIKPVSVERMIGGAKMMPLSQLKKEVKDMGHKLSRVVDGVRKAYNKKELVSKLESMAGGKFSFKQLANDAGRISKKILKVGVPVVAGTVATMEGGPVAGLATAKASGALTDYLLGSGKKRRSRKM